MPVIKPIATKFIRNPTRIIQLILIYLRSVGGYKFRNILYQPNSEMSPFLPTEILLTAQFP